jgi:rare lipoprotein A (peptidoglycan hydrolase)
MKDHDWTWIAGGIVILLIIGLSIFAGHSVTAANKDIEIIRLEEQIGAGRMQVRNARAIARRNRSVIVAWDVVASHYTEASSGGTMANGQPFDEDLLTAAHRVLEFGTIILIENRENGRVSPAMITDRGPARRTGRSLDVSLAVARRLGIVEQGVATLRCYLLVQGRPSTQD